MIDEQVLDEVIPESTEVEQAAEEAAPEEGVRVNGEGLSLGSSIDSLHLPTTPQNSAMTTTFSLSLGEPTNRTTNETNPKENIMDRTVSCYLILVAKKKSYYKDVTDPRSIESVTIKRLTQSRPALAANEVAVRINLTIPPSAFTDSSVEVVIPLTKKDVVRGEADNPNASD